MHTRANYAHHELQVLLTNNPRLAVESTILAKILDPSRGASADVSRVASDLDGAPSSTSGPYAEVVRSDQLLYGGYFFRPSTSEYLHHHRLPSPVRVGRYLIAH